jgi:heptosyltransferase-2
VHRNQILIIQTAFIGDVILATAFVEKVAETYPDSEIDFVLRKGNEVILQNNPHIRNTFVWDKKNKITSLVELIKKIRKNHYQFVFNIQRFLSTGLITSFAKAEIKVGFDKNPLSFLYSEKIKHCIPDFDGSKALHEVERNLKLLKAVTPINPAVPKPNLYLKTQTAPQKIDPYVVLAPNSVWFTKKWPAHKWSELLGLLLETNLDVHFIGAPDEFEYCQKIIGTAASEKVKNNCGKLSLLESAELMSNAKRVIVNDSGPLHLASAVNAKTTALFCSTIPEFGYGPLSDQSIVLESPKKLACRPCGLHGKSQCPLKHFECAEGISAKKVFETV